ncbi:MAG: serine/threonine protein kinase [Oscillospiraceae bacterium]|nr:serine/threonine protein kinase [Oscillospiraceae bacterium]
MYTDTLLFLIGAAGLALAAVGAVYLFVSIKKSKRLLRTKAGHGPGIATVLPESNMDLVPTDISPEPDRETEEATEYMPDALAEIKDTFQKSALEGLYEIEKVIYSGPMSKVYLAKSLKLGNKAVIKFVTHEIGNLSYEHEKLKNLYHPSLPKIIDILTDESGIYLVESYIEGKNLGQLIKEATAQKKVFDTKLIVSWANQLFEVYSYLHNLPDSPIYHLDIKPDNIMVTHGNRLVPIDFGISKRIKDKSQTVAAVSPKYAAPEQFEKNPDPKHKKIMEQRFGELPADFKAGEPDARTDIFGIGATLFELAVGEVFTVQNLPKLKAVPGGLADIISKCVEIDPAKRYQSINEILPELQNLGNTKPPMQKGRLSQRIMALLAALLVILSGGSFAYGGYIYNLEMRSDIGAIPLYVTLSLGQSSEFRIEKERPDGKITLLNPSELVWSQNSDGIAQLDGKRIVGLNVGETLIEGTYRNKPISFFVNVVEAFEGGIDIAQRYEPGHAALLFGEGSRGGHIDGTLSGEARFVSPESISIAANAIYVTDSGFLRKITKDTVETLEILPPYMTPRLVRCAQDGFVYVSTNEWQDGESYKYGIIRLGEVGMAEDIYIADAAYTAIEDFGFSTLDGDILYFIEQNFGMDETYLKTLDIKNPKDIYIITKLPAGTRSLAFGEQGEIYLANAQLGAIYAYTDKELRNFAGISGERAFVDGSAPLFYMPQKLKYAEGRLYVWDFNVLRTIEIADGAAVSCFTLAGEASPTAELEDFKREYAAFDIILPNSQFADFAIVGEEIILTDPKRGAIWKIY